jgi:hypothetical protein
MRLFIGIAFALLVASAHSQQAFFLENCLGLSGQLTSNLAMIFIKRSDAASKSQALNTLSTLVQQCSKAFASSLGEQSSGVDCVALRAEFGIRKLWYTTCYRRKRPRNIERRG